ncbi:MAG TPA: metallophosphoesterase [Steroidobacteraceae bacterium]|nr:metallophosphoesterase [Steroidobacteraceae bacterium]
MAVRSRLAFVVAFLALLVAGAAHAGPDFRFEGVHRIVTVADVHGGYDEFVSILREAAIIDAGLHWRAGDTQFVSLGDLLDRGPDSRKVLDLVMRLEGEAAAAGGAVHVVLGNHEVMNIVGDLRYVSAAEYTAFAGKEDEALREQAWLRLREQEPQAVRADFDALEPAGYYARTAAFSATGKYGSWLLAKPFLIVINDTAFVHGGLPALVAADGLDETNRSLHAELDAYLQAAPEVRDAQQPDLFTSKSPTWYRGQALCYPYTEAENLDAALAALGVSRVIVGHTPTATRRVQSRFDGRVLLLDTGMLRTFYQGSPAALVFENGRWSVAYADRPGERMQPEVAPRAVGARPAGLDDDALEQWLGQAEVVEMEDLDTGVTHPRRVTLRKGGVELRAVFKDLSVDTDELGRSPAIATSDRFEYELAAYKLDRLLDLNMVPVTVARTIGKHRGILQFWIDGAVNVRRMLERKLEPAGDCAAGPQYNLMNVFDVLIDNTDRTQENALFTKDWTLVLIDHTRAFRTDMNSPHLLYRGDLTVPPALARRLATLNRGQLQAALGPYLKKRQIDALLKRRDLLLKGNYAGRRSADRGRQ